MGQDPCLGKLIATSEVELSGLTAMLEATCTECKGAVYIQNTIEATFMARSPEVVNEMDGSEARVSVALVLDVLGSILANSTTRAHSAASVLCGSCPISQNIYDRAAKMIYQATVRVALEFFTQTEQLIFSRRKAWTLIVDAEWSHLVSRAWRRVREARLCLFVRKSSASRQGFSASSPSFSSIATEDYDGSSRGMETFAFDKIVNRLKEKGLISSLETIVSDRDSTMARRMREHPDLSQVTFVNDPGHATNNFRKRVEKSLTRNGLRRKLSIATRLSSRVIGLIKEIENLERPATLPEAVDFLSFQRDCFRSRLSLLASHYTTRQCGDECLCPKTEKKGNEFLCVSAIKEKQVARDIEFEL
jgi:hypothetical protein